MVKISIISPSMNTGRFAQETIESILAQNYNDWEHLVIDGGSTDETLSVLYKYRHIKWISEKDSGPDEAFCKGLALAKGEYVMFCGFSDGYLDRNWFKKCADVLNNNLDVSLVWGFPQYMSEDGNLGRVSYDHFFDKPPPQGKDFLYYWLKTYFHLTEGNFCVRKNVMQECFPVVDPKKVGEECEFLTFNYNFNTAGYLPHFIPVVANFGRQHHDAGGQKQLNNGKMQSWVEKYRQEVDNYRAGLLKGEYKHYYRTGTGESLPDQFEIDKFNAFKIFLPDNQRVSILRRIIGKMKRVITCN